MKRKIEWTKKAKASLDHHCDYISQDSPDSAEKVKREIYKAANQLPNHPELYQIDEYYLNNPGNIRRFFRWSYRIVYQVREDRIIILNVYHTSESPKKIGK